MASDIQAGAKKILDSFLSEKPCFIGRNGTIEIEVLSFWLNYRRAKANPATYPSRLQYQIHINAGVFPNTSENIDAWCEAYVKSMQHLTGGAAGWYAPMVNAEQQILSKFAPNAFTTPLRSLEAYYVPPEYRWTQCLRGKKVAVVSSFADTIRSQLWGEKTASIWRDKQHGLLPIADVEWSFVKTGYSPSVAQDKAAWPIKCDTWQKAVEYVIDEVIKTRASIVLIGCGALGVVIAGRLKEKGISSIVLGGAVQVLFGIKGKRWATHDIISTFWNDAWVWPSEDECPRAARLVEGGCYWKS